MYIWEAPKRAGARDVETGWCQKSNPLSGNFRQSPVPTENDLQIADWAGSVPRRMVWGRPVNRSFSRKGE